MDEENCYSFLEVLEEETFFCILSCIFCKEKINSQSVSEENEETVNCSVLIFDCFKIEIQKESCDFKMCESCIKRLKDACKLKSLIEDANKLLIESSRSHKNNFNNILKTKSTSIIKDKIVENLVHIDVPEYEWDKNTDLEDLLHIGNDNIEKHVIAIIGDTGESYIDSKSDKKIPNTATRFSCKLCSRTYRKKDALQQHVRSIHEGIKPFLCRLCSERFSWGFQKNKHMFEVHNWKSKSFPCVTCGKIFYTAKFLQKHVDALHNEMSDSRKKFSCNICEKSYLKKNSLADHLKVHANIRNFECEYCGKTFFSNNNLRNHIKIHFKDKKYC